MSFDVTEAIALAKDLLETSKDFRTHDPELAQQFAGRAFEICDDLGIDRDLIGAPSVAIVDHPVAVVDDPIDDEDPADAVVDLAPTRTVDEETQETSQQLRDLLQQQARVLENARQQQSSDAPKAERRSFRLFGRSHDQPFAGMQSASA